MKRCLKISLRVTKAPKNLLSEIQRHARELTLEGTVQPVPAEGEVRIIACGESDDIESFLDLLHGGFNGWFADEVNTQPFLNERDYRGTFRIIE